MEPDASLALPTQFSKEKYILDSSPEKLHKELEEELKLSSTDLRSHAWYHGRIPREVSRSQAGISALDPSTPCLGQPQPGLQSADSLWLFRQQERVPGTYCGL